MRLPKSKLLKPAALKKAFSQSENPIAEFKSALKHAHAQLAEVQHQGISAAELVEQYTWVVDRLVVLAWEYFYNSDSETKVSLVAVGGYGRGELHPHSDVDLLILLEKENYTELQQTIESFLRFLWDIGFEVGHSVRSIRDCIKEARADITIMTNLLESRLLDGDLALLQSLDDKLRNGRLWSNEKFFTAKYEEQLERHTSYQETAYSLEPNLKESPGGLRDLQTILWVYNRHFGVRSFKEMKDQGHLNNDEYRLLVRARNMLWKLRCGLHLNNGRREDRLLFDNQRQLATDYGYEDTAGHLAVEQLMKRYYRTAKLVIYLNEVLLSHYRVAHSKRFSLGVSKTLGKDFLLKNKMIEARSVDIFEQRPAAMMELFQLMQRHHVDAIHPDTIRAIRASLSSVTPKIRASQTCKKLFLELFSNEGNELGNVLSRMNDYGVLGAYLPVFGAIVGQMQHDLFHVYTVDGHTLKVIQNLMRLRINEEEYPLASRVLDGLYKPERLLVAALFHDIAKGRGGDHSVLGENDAIQFSLDHDLSDYDSKLVGWLVRNHLIMSHFSQRRDISDPDVIREFAAIVGDHEYLDNLYLLTHADIRGTSPKVWNAWKGQLLMELYKATSQALDRGEARPINEQAHVEDDQAAALERLKAQLGSNFTPDLEQRVHEFWSTLRNDYFIRNEPYYIAWHAASLCQSAAIELPIVSVRYSERLEANMVFIVAPKSKELLAKVTFGFDFLELSIIEAQLQNSRSGLALYSFNSTSADFNAIREPQKLRQVEQRLRHRILQHDGDQLISRRSASRALKHFPIAAKIIFSQTHPSYTVMEVSAQDQPGLLHNVALILQRNNIKPVSAKIATFGERAEDVFFIQMPDGTPVVDENLLASLEQDLSEALNKNSTSGKRSRVA